MGKTNGGTPRKKALIILAAVILTSVAAGAFVLLSSQGEKVEFDVLSEKDYPQEISGDVIPEYRSLERALACVVDEKVYVIVTRGEKPASGYKVKIDRMKLEKDKDKTNLVVYAVFRDPAKEDSMSQVLNYPVSVAVTELGKLPDDIELRVQYEE